MSDESFLHAVLAQINFVLHTKSGVRIPTTCVCVGGGRGGGGGCVCVCVCDNNSDTFISTSGRYFIWTVLSLGSC